MTKPCSRDLQCSVLMRNVLQQAVLKVFFLSPALALPCSKQRDGSLGSLAPVLPQRIHFLLIFCEKGRTRNLEPPSNDHTSHSRLGFLSLRNFEVASKAAGYK